MLFRAKLNYKSRLCSPGRTYYSEFCERLLTRRLRESDVSHKRVRLVRIGENIHRNVAPSRSGLLVPASQSNLRSGLIHYMKEYGSWRRCGAERIPIENNTARHMYDVWPVHTTDVHSLLMTVSRCVPPTGYHESDLNGGYSSDAACNEDGDGATGGLHAQNVREDACFGVRGE